MAAMSPEAVSEPLAALTGADALAGDARLRVYSSMATWCGSCVREVPEMKVFRETFSPEEVAILGVPIDPTDTAAALNGWKDKNGAVFSLLADLPVEERKGFQERVSGLLGADGVPATIVTDREGRVLAAQWGLPTVSTMRTLLSGLK